MYQFKGLEDTITAIATPSGVGGIAIVRISGNEALHIADRIFRPKGSIKPSQAKGFTVHYGWIIKTNDDERGRRDEGRETKDDIVDEVLLTIMRAPKSYTGQHAVEISTHGGGAVARAVLETVLAAGARLAEPGEFTKRAFLNGRMDLAQAEAVLDIIRAKTESFVRISQYQLKGELSLQIENIRQSLMKVYTTLEAFINFPEDDIDAPTSDNIHQRIEEQSQHIQKLLANSSNGRLLKEGIRAVLCGKPNVGKSSLLNVLLKHPRAIVTDIAGTTRDVLEEEARIKDIPLQLVDTAGILEPRDLIEQEAVKRSRASIKSADLVLLVLDNSTPLEEEDRLLIEQIKDRPVIAVINKCDLLEHSVETRHCLASKFKNIVNVSALSHQGIAQLEEIIVKSVWQGESLDTRNIFVTNLRHIQALKQADVALQAALRVMDEGLSIEFISEHLKTAINQLDAVLGRNVDADLLDTIFSEFCIGK